MKIYTPPEIAKMLHVCRDTVRGWIRDGDLAASNIASRTSSRPQYRVTQEQLDAFLESKTVAPLPVTSRRHREMDIPRYVGQR